MLDNFPVVYTFPRRRIPACIPHGIKDSLCEALPALIAARPQQIRSSWRDSDSGTGRSPSLTLSRDSESVGAGD
jgi:hypothetical protein